MLDRPAGGDSAVLVSLDFGDPGYAESLSELIHLAGSARVESLAVVEGRRGRPDPALYAGKGKVEQVADAVRESGASVVIFNHDLSPAQQRNLEERLKCRVIDRTALILDIFAQRAKSHEGKLQVELAQLEHLATRLVGGWTHLERQKGGIGLRGPGETQLETDRRLIGNRVKVLKDKLGRLERQRAIQRKARQRAGVVSVSLVGYTNAGKSTLFNALTRARAYAADQLFATLDTTSRRTYIPEFGPVVVSDTVGFIRHLPHSLVAAFHATLEETVRADLLLHVVDSSSPARDEQVAEVNKVLAEIRADAIPQILVFNKSDRTGLAPEIQRDDCGRISRVRLSARTGDGVGLLRAALAEVAAAHHIERTVTGDAARQAASA
ncbi:MAG TPA: GTPase HflX [Burkholderiales bacterium]|nr:GTPase HflX [Burkholderiales bacterium]